MTGKFSFLLRSLPAISRTQLVSGAVLFVGLPGSIVLFKDTYVVNKAIHSVIDPAKTYLLEPFGKFTDHVRHGFFSIGNTLFDWSRVRNEKSSGFVLVKEKVAELPSIVIKGGKKAFIATKDLTISFFNFLFFDLPNFISKNGIQAAKDYIKHYLRPFKSLWTRPVDDRLRSMKTRLDQFVECLKTPGFFDSLTSMNKFFFQFKDKIDLLDDKQLAEMIDIYLDDPMEMKTKVDAIFSNLDMEKDKEVINKFDAKLMMDFVRGENVEQLKATLAAVKTSEEIAGIAQRLAEIFTPSRSSEARETTSMKVGEAFNSWFTGTVSKWNEWFG